MATLAGAVHDALAPYVGDMVADTCVRATALSIGKTSDTLDRSDLPALEGNVRRLLAPVAPPNVIDLIVRELERSAVA